MSFRLKDLTLRFPNKMSPISNGKLPQNINKNRAGTTINSAREKLEVSLCSPKKEKSELNIFPYPGLSIGFMKLQKRTCSNKLPSSYPPLNYSNYFSDVYLNSETLSLLHGKNTQIETNAPGKIDFSLPNKTDFRRLRRKSWCENKNNQVDLTAFVNNETRSAGKAYTKMNRNKFELIPVTKYRSRNAVQDTLGLRIKGIFKHSRLLN